MSRYLTKLEVSQKQAYIFSSNKLQENIINSAVIAKVLDPKYLEEVLAPVGYTDKKNMVYSGGGHTILEFASEEEAKAAVSVLTEKVYRDFDGLQIFATSLKYKEELSVQENLVNLTKKLEKKKALREAYFHQGTYGIEFIDSTTLDAVPDNQNHDIKEKIKNKEYKVEKSFYPEGFEPARAFGNLGGSKDESNFIAVVHIDGNGMGKRVEDLYEIIGDADWDTTKKKLRDFSEGIDKDFKKAMKDMTEIVGKNIRAGQLKDLNLNEFFPVRRVITAGDDICFVTEGRIGLECAVTFIRELAKIKNGVDEKNYAACAGVAIVHQKYPFYKAYELAEELCSNAKSFGSNISPKDNGRSVSAIDWHIEFGELGDSMAEIRKAYKTLDGNELTLRPYLVDAPDEIMNKDELACHKYDNFKTLILRLIRKEALYSTGKLKELRGALKAGEAESYNYLSFNRMTDIISDAKPLLNVPDLSGIGQGKVPDEHVFVTSTVDDKKHSLLFDAIELLDTYIGFEKGE